MKLGSAPLERTGGLALAAPELGTDPLPIRPIQPSPCSRACPAGIDVKAYVSSIAAGRFAEALAVVRERCPLPGVCGRVCTHPCEAACRRADFDEPVAIRALKRFVADLGRDLPWSSPLPPVHRQQAVAVIGSGPAGLTAAYDLRRAGYPVTVFEAEREPGGMLRHGIADYRLPPDVLAREIDALLATGIELRTECRLGRDVQLEGLLRSGYGAVLLAVGHPLGRGLRVPGEERCAEVRDALAFLREVNGGARPRVGRRVLVVGGGSTAVEAARTARRLGAASVEILYRRSRAEMPADEEELVAAAAEGVRLRLLAAPTRVVTDAGRLIALECCRMELGEADASGRRRPVLVEGSGFCVPADLVLAAVGQAADLSFLPQELSFRLDERGALAADPATGATRLTGVFAAGDVAGGPATVVHAIGTGHAVASSIREYLEKGPLAAAAPRRADDDPAPSEAEPREHELAPAAPEPAPREHPAAAHVLDDPGFPEVERAFALEQAVAEARRCLRCGPCSECRTCVDSCGHRHVELRMELREAGGRWRGRTLLRAPLAFTERLDGERPLACSLVEEGGAGEDLGAGAVAELHAARNHILAERCRGCLACAEVCPFDAVHAFTRDDELRARIESSACRGCGLCAGVCPTAAAVPWTLASETWAAAPASEGPSIDGARVVLTCREGAALDGARRAPDGRRVELFAFPCVGQVTAGAIVELHRKGAAEVVVAGCGGEHCRYGPGPSLAAERTREARELVRLAGGDGSTIVCAPLGARLTDLVHGREECHASGR